jgi:hypothetical protein
MRIGPPGLMPEPGQYSFPRKQMPNRPTVRQGAAFVSHQCINVIGIMPFRRNRDMARALAPRR